MYLRFTRRLKDGKEHRYWSVGESKRCSGGRVVQSTTDDRTLILSRYTELNADHKILARELRLDLPPQPPPRITAAGLISPVPHPAL
jgi:hypothetical protein